MENNTSENKTTCYVVLAIRYAHTLYIIECNLFNLARLVQDTVTGKISGTSTNSIKYRQTITN